MAAIDWDSAVLEDALGFEDRLDDTVDGGWDGALRSPVGRLLPLPPHMRGRSATAAQWHAIGEVARHAGRWFPGTFDPATPARGGRVDRARRHRGAIVSPLRPDLQFYNPRRRRTTHVEVDTSSGRMRRHIAARDPSRRNVFVLVDPATGRLLEKHVFPAGAADRPGLDDPRLDSVAPRGRSLVLRRDDLFEAGPGR